ncbi:AraC family transcriptional regulator [Methylobacterium terricola]|uniref:AraC family transcriptional regulator n=1 Tax=Methylobacterium terricola TaxID=2583531 RepID=UPI001486B3DD|nr:helix-turn-helix transcriptional regulator [Methylobacterium terricola]
MPTSSVAVRSEVGPACLQAIARDYPDGAVVGEHCHIDGQSIHATAGVMEIQAARRLWLVPPQRGLWVPPRLAHALRARGGVSLRTLYVAPDRAKRLLGDTPCGFAVPLLVRELILRMLDPCVAGDRDRNGRLAAVLVDELADLHPDGISLSMPSDPRLARVCASILAQPGEERRIDDFARQAGASVRTLGRLALHELGCPLSAWRQQARVLSAVPRLIAGEPVTRVAQSLGYETNGAFAAIFKRLIGVSPREYHKSC